MPKREVDVRLEDVLLRIGRIEEMIVAINSADQLAGKQLYRDAMERNFEVIGKAIYHITTLRPELSITQRDKIIALRHIIVHDYYEVDPNQLCVRYQSSSITEERNSVLYRPGKSKIVWYKHA